MYRISRYGVTDFGPEPFVTNIQRAAIHNTNFRTALWTGKYLQLTLMSIPVGGEIGLEAHSDLDQFLRLEMGRGLVKMGASSDKLNYQANVSSGYVVFIPAGTYHNLINVGSTPIKLYSIYAPPQHPRGTVHQTKQIADQAEEH
ncbi:MAG: cupin domain-containing protein [Bacillota bacterium]|jgi:mannose-6-phosphate isomerase-like protein (cupin superfamily)|nr:cupin domain-containing protein [Bacillota bacterium]HHU43932.1 cupin domain-containing protein [Clostridiales bacterium]